MDTLGCIQVTVTPLHPPPHPSTISTQYNSGTFVKVLERLTSDTSSQSVISKAVVASTQTPQRDTLTLVYNADLNTAPTSLVSSIPQPSFSSSTLSCVNAPVYVKRLPTVASTKVTRGEITGSVRNQQKPLQFTKQSKPEVVTEALSAGPLKQTKIVIEKSSRKLMLSKPVSPTLSRTDVVQKPCKTKDSPKIASHLRDVRQMSKEERDKIEGQFSQLEEVAACLVYTDGSSQLRPYMIKGKTAGAPTPQPQGLCIAYPANSLESGSSPNLNYVFLPLSKADDTLYSWCRKQVRAILSCSRVIAYRGQKMVTCVISCFDLLEHSNEWQQWTILDTHVGVWLLDPDHPPESFAHLLDRLGMRLHLSQTNESAVQLCADISLLGSTMVETYKRLQKNDLWMLFEKIEVKLIPILAAMDFAGIQIDSNKLLEYAELLKIKVSKVEELAYKAAGHKFSINSTVQLRQVLFDELHLDDLCGRKLSKTQVCKLKSTSEGVLTQLEGLHPLPRLVLEYRQLCKINATYITGILPYIAKGTLKASWQHTGAATGRLTSMSPNIQAFPKQSINLGVVKESYIVGKEPEEVSIDIREAVESRSGYTFIAADFRSIELRLVAHFSGDSLLMSVLKSRKTPDVFVHLASEWLGVAVEQVTPAHRERTKRVVYAVVYGVGKERLAEILNVEPSYAKDLTNSFLDKFPGVKNFITKTIEECKNEGYLVSICGRRRWFPHINSSNNQLRLHTERQAVNFVVQGSAADICKCGMIEVGKLLARDHPKARLLLQIHDEMIFEVPDSEVQEVAGMLKSSLEKLDLLNYNLKVPLEIRLMAGKTWSSLTDL